MKRTQARKIMMQAMFSMDSLGDSSAEYFNRFIEEKIQDKKQLAYANDVYQTWSDHKSEIDKMISQYSHGWTMDRIAKTDLAVLRLAITEILYCEDIPYKSAISEALKLSEEFGTQKSRKFVHGILSTVTKEAGYENPKK